MSIRHVQSINELPCLLSLLIFTIVSLCKISAVSNKRELSATELKDFLQEGRWSQNACILFYSDGSKNDKLYERVSQKISKSYSNVVFMKALLTMVNDHSNESKVKCYLGKYKPQWFYFGEKIRFSKWLKSKLSDIRSTFKILQHVDIENESQENGVMLILAIPGDKYYEELEGTLERIADVSEKNISVYMVPPNTKLERQLYEQQKITTFPTVQIYWRELKHQPLKMVHQFTGPFEVEEISIKLHLLIHEMRGNGVIISAESLVSYLSTPQDLVQPVIMLVYTSHSTASYRALYALYRASLVTGRKFQILAADISSPGVMFALSKYIQASIITNLPFTLCLYKEQTKDGLKMAQKAMDAKVIPTLSAMEDFLKATNLLEKNPERKFMFYDFMTCSSNQSIWCGIGDGQSTELKSKDSIPKQIRQLRRRSVQKLRYVTRGIWDRLFSSDRLLTHHEAVLGQPRTRLILVIFIRQDCSYCNVLLPEFQRVGKSVAYIKGASTFLMNCTKTPTMCRDENITGYPTLILYRVVSSYAHDSCLPHEYLNEPTRIDYHGELNAESVLSWIGSYAISSVELASEDRSYTWKDRDILLKAKLYTKSYAEQYLRRSLSNRLLPYRCVVLLCELLFARIKCLGVPEEGVAIDVNEKQLYVSEVEFKRRDGAELTLFKTGDLLQNTLKKEAALHFGSLHRKHKYLSNFYCEDDHVRCTKFILQFTVDHLRMPLSHVNAMMFHSHQKGLDDMWEKPILLALAHADNITENSTFYEDLYGLSVRFYDKVIVALLDVDRHPYWAHSFVPRGYQSMIQGLKETPPLYRYPRFCMLTLTNHTYAAFYPKINGLKRSHIWSSLDVNKLEKFVVNFLSHEISLVETESF